MCTACVGCTCVAGRANIARRGTLSNTLQNEKMKKFESSMTKVDSERAITCSGPASRPLDSIGLMCLRRRSCCRLRRRLRQSRSDWPNDSTIDCWLLCCCLRRSMRKRRTWRRRRTTTNRCCSHCCCCYWSFCARILQERSRIRSSSLCVILSLVNLFLFIIKSCHSSTNN